jgi:2-polyprenyl-3-methyl-5-hydroxy-6-metoxy-1,4-benzoquinol methylase
MLPPEQALALADENSPAFVCGAFELATATIKSEPQIEKAFRTGAGFGWHEHDPGVFTGCERFFRPGYNANLVSSWLPALDGVEEKLRIGAKVADVGCGLGASSRLMAEAYPRSRITGFDYHRESIDLAREKAQAAGLADRLRFEVAPAQRFPGTGYDLVTMFDCLHDMGDPVGAARHVKQALAPDGTWLIVEPIAGDTVEANLNPVGRAYYAFSNFLCTPSSLSQDVGLALGAQAGEKRIREVVTSAGFTRFRRVAETPFNAVYEARP